MNITIMTTIMKTTIMSMITNIIMNMTRTAPADATITKNMSMITATTMNTITIIEDHDHEHHHEHDENCTCGCHDHEHHHHHHADEVFTSWGNETPHKFTKEKIEDVLKTLCETDDYGTILRAKGMVEDENGTWIYFDMVPGEYELRDGEPDYTGRLCVIGCNIDEHRLEELFGIAESGKKLLRDGDLYERNTSIFIYRFYGQRQDRPRRRRRYLMQGFAEEWKKRCDLL